MATLNGTNTLPAAVARQMPSLLVEQASYWEVGIDVGSDFSIAFATPVFVTHEGKREAEYRGRLST
jgi:hypothetical protein